VWVDLDQRIPTAVPANATADEYSRLRALINEALAIKKQELACYRQYDSGYAADWKGVIDRSVDVKKATELRKEAAERMLPTEEAEVGDAEQRVGALNDDASEDAARLRKILGMKRKNVEQLTRILKESEGSVDKVDVTVNLGERMIAILNADLGSTAIDEDLYTSVYMGLEIVIDNYVARLKPMPTDRDREWRR
jgi:hypothetical protein